MMAKFGAVDELGGISILNTVAEQVKNLNPRVEDAVVDVLVEREVEKRSNALVVLIDRIAVLEKEFNKSKPDNVALDETGKVVTENWTRKGLEARNKIKQKIEKITAAINKALLEKDYSNVYQLANEKEGTADKNKGEGGSED